MALTIPFEIAGAGATTFSSAGSALAANQRLTAGVGSVANSALTIRIPTTANPPVTAYVSGHSFSQTTAGAAIFVAQGTNVFTLSTSQAYASAVKLAGGNAASTGTIAIMLTAFGWECAQGVQTGTITLTVSSYALSGNPGSTTIIATPAVTTSTATITVTAVPTASDSGEYTCEEEARRLWVLGYV